MADVRLILPAPVQGAEASLEPHNRQYVVSNQNRWSRSSFNFRDLAGDTWCELTLQLSWHSEEKSKLVHDFAVIGVDFLTDDGSIIDFTHVPGLTRTQIHPHSFYIPGPSYFDQGSELTNSAKVQCTFLVPSPAKHICVTIRSWRNSHPFTVVNPCLEQLAPGSPDRDASRELPEIADASRASSRRTWHALSTEPAWFQYGVVPGQTLFIRGQLINGSEGGDGALARIVFRDAAGGLLPPPDEIPVSPAVGAFIDIPTHRQARRFTLELPAPAQASTVEVGLQVWRDGASIALVTPLEISLGDDLLLENILGEHITSAEDFLRETFKRLEGSFTPDSARTNSSLSKDLLDQSSVASLFTYHDKLRAIQRGDKTAVAGDQLILCDLQPWTLPEAPAWTEDPFRSTAWRMEYQSLSWILDLVKGQGIDAIRKATDLVVSWSLLNPWGHPKDAISAYPSLIAVRAEVFLHVLALGLSHKRVTDSRKQETLLAEVLRHGFALAEIIGQNIFSHSVLQIRTACALLSLARAVPRFPIANHWASIALAQLRSAFDQLIAPDGSSIEQSQHYRLEIISLGVILIHHLEGVAEARDLREHLISRLTKSLRLAVAVTDPAGRLPPFGDVRRDHHASWLRRLISMYGRWLLTDRDLTEELAYPTGMRMFVSESAGIVSFRNYERRPDWSYLCASFHEQCHENGHYDCTSFVYTAQGVEWITDPGGSSLYEAGPVRQYLLSSRAHNVGLPNGREQSAGRGWVEANTSLGQAHLIRIGTNVHGPSYKHARIFLCLNDLSAVAIFDSFETSQPLLTFEGLIHFGENIAVALANSMLAIGFHKRNRLRMTPYAITGQFTGFEIMNGRSDRPGSLQGYVVNRTGEIQPANVLRYRFSGTGHACGGLILGLNLQSQNRIVELLTSQEVKDLLR